MDLNFTEELNKSFSRKPVSKSLMTTYYSLLLTAGIYLSMLAFITTSANGLLLLTIYKNSKPYFRKPLTILIAALALADFLTGLIIDPLYSGIYFSLYFKSISRSAYLRLAEVTMLFSVITMNASYLIVLTLSCTQLVAITFPYKEKTIITSRTVSISVGIAYVYSISFALSYVMGIPENIFQQLEVFLHMTGITVILIAAYVCLQISYTRQRGRFRRLTSESKHGGQSISRVHNDARSTSGDRKFLMVNLLLIACLLLTSLPVTVVWYYRIFSLRFLTTSEMIAYRNIALVVDNFLFLKFLLDPFVYAWRMPKYRQALRRTLINASSNFMFNCNSNNSNSRRERSNTKSSVRTIIQIFGRHSYRISNTKRTKSLRNIAVDEDIV